MNDNIFIHEDDYCQIQILPFENLEFIHSQMEEIFGFRNENFNENGVEKIYVRKNPNFPLISKKISCKDLESLILHSKFEKIKNVNIGYGNTYINSKNFGFGTEKCAILFECEENKVKTIWLKFYWIATDNEKENLTKLLIEFGEIWNLILVDWNQCVVVELTEENLNKYLNE